MSFHVTWNKVLKARTDTKDVLWKANRTMFLILKYLLQIKHDFCPFNKNSLEPSCKAAISAVSSTQSLLCLPLTLKSREEVSTAH